MPEAVSASLSARADSTLSAVWPVRSRDPRLQRAERWLRYAVPGALSIFLACLVALATIHIRGQRAEILSGAEAEVEGFARLAAHALRTAEGSRTSLHALLPEDGRHPGRRLVLLNPNSRIAEAHPPLPAEMETLPDILGPSEPLSALGERAGAVLLDLPGGERVLAAVHNLPGGKGQIAVLQPVDPLMVGWGARTRDQIVLVGAAILVIVGVGIAYGLQTRQATLADRACEQIRLRLETALRRSDCGLWDWDIARGRIYWSDSMYTLLGYRREQPYLAFGTVNALVHPDDGDLYSLARAVAANQTHVDHAFHLIVSDPTPEVLSEELPALIREGYTSFKIYMTYDDLKLDDGQILDVLEVARKHDAMAMIHAENSDCIEWLTKRLEAAGRTAPRFHSHSRPMLVEREAFDAKPAQATSA